MKKKIKKILVVSLSLILEFVPRVAIVRQKGRRDRVQRGARASVHEQWHAVWRGVERTRHWKQKIRRLTAPSLSLLSLLSIGSAGLFIVSRFGP